MTPVDSATVVVKVGGSLLDWPDFPRALDAWLRNERVGRPVLVVGGGAMVDVLRDLDAMHGLGETRSHNLALRALDVTCHLLAGLVPGLAPVMATDDLAAAWESGHVPVLTPRVFLETVDRRGPDPLPESWSATSDSIAARLARYLRAPRLALLKSTTPTEPLTRSEAAVRGLVDPVFPLASRGIPTVVAVNLRATPPVGVTLEGDPD